MEDLIVSLAILQAFKWREHSLTRKSRKRLHSRWKFLPSRDNKPSKTDQEEERDGPDELGLGDVGE